PRGRCGVAHHRGAGGTADRHRHGRGGRALLSLDPAAQARTTGVVSAMLEARNVSVAIDRKPIVDRVDFSAKAGEVTAIVGPNGSGKSTFLKALCRDLGYSGAVFLNGRNLADLKAFEIATMRAVLPQASVLTFPFTVHEVVRMGLTTGVSGLEPRTEAMLPVEALARVDLEGFGGRMYQSLSGGEQQRVQLARVLCQV